MSLGLLELELDDTGQRRVAQDPSWQWLCRFELRTVQGEVEGRTDPGVETLVLLLSGTYDLEAGGGSWLSRGVRKSAFEGKPVGLFLPPGTRYAFRNGEGEVLMVSGRQPPPPSEPDTVEETLSKKPLLPMAGSGKAFNPKTGEWLREEDFPSAPEAILPRRVQEQQLGQNLLRQVFPFDYKALCLCLCECVIQDGTTLDVPRLDIANYPEETAVYFTTNGTVRASQGDTEIALTQQGVVAGQNLVLTAEGGDAYVAIARAGAKQPSR